MDYNGPCLRTDYYTSHDCEAGIPWCHVSGGTTWHILLPHGPRTQAGRLPFVRAIPVTDPQDADGWRWRLEIGAWHLPLYRRCISPFRPGFPAKGVRFERRAVLYSGYMSAQSGSSFFGAIQPGLQEFGTYTLWLTRGV